MNVVSVLMAEGSWMTILLSFCLLFFLMILLIERGKFVHALRKIPYPTALPIIGNAYQLNCSHEGKTAPIPYCAVKKTLT